MAINGEITVGTYMAYIGTGRLVDLADPQPGTHHRAGLDGHGLVRPPDGNRQAGSVNRSSMAASSPKVRYEATWFSRMSRSCIRTASRMSSRMSRSTSSPDRPSHCSARPARARPRWSICCRVSTNTRAGRILLDGVELKDYPRAYLRQQIGIVEQEPFLFSRSIRENITYGVGRDVPQDEDRARCQSRRRP